MKLQEKLYDAFGELIYVVAMSDGKIQPEELEVIEKKLATHPWGESIKWSFNYEVKKEQPIDELYRNVISYCEMHGPDEEYTFLLEVINDLAVASSGMQAEEQAVIDSFAYELTTKFKADIDRING